MTMRKVDLFFGLAVCLFGLVAARSGFANESIEIVKAQGGVTVSADGKQQAVATKSVLPPANVLSTGADGRAVVRVGNTGFIVLEKNSKVEINNANDHAGFFRQLTGAVYYAVNTIKGRDRTLEVRTISATMGIRGTRFLVVDTSERKEVGMRKGTLGVVSPNEEFEIHKMVSQDEFEALKREGRAAVSKEKSDFDNYKENVQREFVEYQREFSLGADRMVSFSGTRADDRPLSGETKKDLETLEDYAQEWLNTVQD